MVTLINTAHLTGVKTMQDTTKITPPVMDDRNAWRYGFTPQAEIWNGRLAMIGFTAYLLWDLAGYSVVRDLFHFMG